MSQSLKINPKERTNLLENQDIATAKKISHDIKHLNEKYSDQGTLLRIQKQSTSEENMNKALHDLEHSDQRPSNTSERRTKSKNRKSSHQKTKKKSRLSSSSFERDDVDGENYDKMIHQILEGEDTFN
jgi:hypothetical protein